MCVPGDFGDPIGSAAMAARGQPHVGAPVKSSVCNPHIVGGDDQRREFPRLPTLLPDVLQKWLSGNHMQWFSRETCRTPAGWNNADCQFHWVAVALICWFKMISTAAGTSSTTQSAMLRVVSRSDPLRTRMVRTPNL